MGMTQFDQNDIYTIMNTTYLFYGFGAEYVLHPVYEAMKQHGHQCIEIDALTIADSKTQIENLQGSEVVFITSAHFLLNEKNFKYFYPTDNHFYGTLEVMALLKPKASVYVPHDLTQPLIDFEKDYLNQFTTFCSPCEPFTSVYSHYTQTREVGWIKYPQKPNTIIRKQGAIWFLSDFILHLNWGVEKSFKLLAPILRQGVSIKFPLWPGSDEFETYFSKNGTHVFPSKANSIDLIQAHDIVLTNGLSSVIAESYFLGKTTVNIMEGSHYGDRKPYLETLFPQLHFIETIREFDLRTIPVRKRAPVLKPFQMDHMVQFLSEL